jgi:long-subunit acyl-CoA synthetase (AMP-forming)
MKINGATDKIWTFRDMLEQSSLMAKVMAGAGVKQNDVITIISENRHEFAAISFGSIFLNAIVAPINATYTERKMTLKILFMIILSLK